MGIIGILSYKFKVFLTNCLVKISISKNIILNPKYKTEHSYDNVYVRDFYLGAQEEADLSLIGDEDELAKRFSEFDKIDKKITPEDRKNATDIIKAEKNDLQKDDDLINSLPEEEWMDF